MAVGVVEQLEVIDVGEQQAQRFALRARRLRRDAELVVEIFAVRDPGHAVGVRLVLGPGEVGPQPLDLLRGLGHIGLDPAGMRQHVTGRGDDLGDQALEIGGWLDVVQLAAQAGQAVTVGGGLVRHAADHREQIGHRALDPLAGRVEQPDLTAGTEEPLVKLGQASLGERLALLLDQAQARAQFRVAARAMAVPDQVVIGARGDLPLCHLGERGEPELPGLLDRVDVHRWLSTAQIHRGCRERRLTAP